MKKFLLSLTVYFAASTLFAQEQAATNPALSFGTPTGCAAELNGYRPKIYVANFFVTYGKKDMGRLIADYIARRFEADGRFEVISREEIEDSMRPLFKAKLPADKYLQTTVELATARDADCVIFGRISKAGSKRVSFLVRMASVKTGENVRNVDTEVNRKEALAFLEGVGDSFVSYFQTAAAPIAATPVAESGKERVGGFYFNVIGGGGYLDLSSSALNRGVGGPAGNFGLKLGLTLGSTVSIFGAVDGFSAFDPTFRVGNATGNASSVGVSAKLSGNMFGGGIAFYSPSQFFIAGTVGAAQASISYTYNSLTYTESTDMGLGASLGLGQEWSLNKHWGLGVCLLGHYAQLSSNGVSWQQIYAGLALTATYN